MCIYTDTHTHTLTSKEHLQQASSHHLYLHMQLHIIHLKIIREIQEEKFNHQIINTHIYVYISYFFKKKCIYIYTYGKTLEHVLQSKSKLFIALINIEIYFPQVWSTIHANLHVKSTLLINLFYSLKTLLPI